MTRPTLDQARTVLAMAIAPRAFARVTQIESALARLDATTLSDDEKVFAVEQASKFAAASGGYFPDELERLVDVFFKILATARVTSENLHQMGHLGIAIHITPETLAACEREARES